MYIITLFGGLLETLDNSQYGPYSIQGLSLHSYPIVSVRKQKKIPSMNECDKIFTGLETTIMVQCDKHCTHQMININMIV